MTDVSYNSRMAHDCCWMSRREETLIDLFSFRQLPEVWNKPAPNRVIDAVIVFFSALPPILDGVFGYMSAQRKGNKRVLEKGNRWQKVPVTFKRCSLNSAQSDGVGVGELAPSQITCAVSQYPQHTCAQGLEHLPLWMPVCQQGLAATQGKTWFFLCGLK